MDLDVVVDLDVVDFDDVVSRPGADRFDATVPLTGVCELDRRGAARFAVRAGARLGDPWVRVAMSKSS